MAGAFQQDAFQNDAFQLDETAQQPVSRANITASGIFRPAKRVLSQRRTFLSLTSGTIESNFTADAILLRTQTGSLTADGVLLRAQSASLTADAVLVQTTSGSFTADAIVFRTQSGSFTADAIIFSSGAGSFTADAVITIDFIPRRQLIPWRPAKRFLTQRRPFAPLSPATTVASTFTADSFIVEYAPPVFITTGPSGSGFLDSSVTGTGDWKARFVLGGASIHWANGLWVKGGNSGAIHTSPDGLVWTSRTSPTASGITDISYGNGYWVANTASRILTSPDGINWTQNSQSFVANLTDVAYGNGYWVAAFGQNAIYTAPDPTGTWTSKLPGFGSDNVLDAHYGADDALWVIVGTNGKMATAPDPTGTWTLRTSSFGTTSIRAVWYGQDGYWVAVGDSGKIATATDPTGTWTQQTSPFTQNIQDVTYNGHIQRWAALSNTTEGVATTIDPTSGWALEPTYGGAKSHTKIAAAAPWRPPFQRPQIWRRIRQGLQRRVFLPTSQLSFTADAWIVGPGTLGSFTADAITSREVTGSFTADAMVSQTNTGSFSADALVQRIQTGSFTANADILVGVRNYGTFTADAFILGWLRADAVLKATITSFFRANAWLEATPSFTADAVISQGTPHTGSVTADAVLLTTSTQTDATASFTANAVIYNPNYSVQDDVPTAYDIVITYNGEDITSDVIFAGSEFISRVNGSAGSCRLRVKDVDHSKSFITGKELTVDINGTRMWGGYVMRVQKTFFFPAQDTTNDEDVPRAWVIEGADYNILFQKRIIFSSNHPTTKIDWSYSADTYDDTIIKNIFDHFLDLSGLGISRAGVTRVDKAILDIPGLNHRGAVASAGYTWGQVMSNIARATGAVYYISPDKVLHYVDVDTADNVWVLKDRPTGLWDLGYRDLEIPFVAERMVNDMLVWGAALGSRDIRFSRVQDATSINTHGRWQDGLFSSALYRQSNVDRVADSYVYGTPQSKRGGKDDQVSFTATVFRPVFVAGQKVRCISEVFAYDDVLPIRQVTLTFPVKGDDANTAYPQLQLVNSHEIDQPWSIAEWRWPRLDIPTIGPGGGTTIADPGGCECGITDTFTRTVGPDAWGTSDAGIPWSWFGEAQSDASVGNGVGVISATGGLPGGGPYVYVSLDDPAPGVPTDITFDLRITTQSNSGTGYCYMSAAYGGSAGEPHLWMVYQVGIGANVTPEIILGYRSSISGTNFFPSVEMTLTTGTWYSVRLHLVDGDFAALRIWERADPEPSTWLLQADVSAEPLWSSTYVGTNQSIFSFDAYTEDTGDNLAYETDNLNVVGVDACSENRFDGFNRTVSGALGTSDVGKTWTSSSGAGYATPYANGSMFQADYTTSPVRRTSYSYQEWLGSTGPWTGNAFTMTTRVMMNPAAGTNNGDTLRWEIAEVGGGDGIGVIFSPRQYSNGLSRLRVFSDNGAGESADADSAPLGTFTSNVWYLLKWEYLRESYIRAKVWADGTTEPDWQVVALHDPGGGEWVHADLNGDFYFIVWFEQASPGAPTVLWNQTKYIDYIDFDYDGKPCSCMPSGADEFDRTVTVTATSPTVGHQLGTGGLGQWDVQALGATSFTNVGVDGAQASFQRAGTSPASGRVTYISPPNRRRWTYPIEILIDSSRDALTNNFLELWLRTGVDMAYGDLLHYISFDWNPAGSSFHASLNIWYEGGYQDSVSTPYPYEDKGFTTGEVHHLKWSIDDTVMKGKVWRAGFSEPSTWDLELTYPSGTLDAILLDAMFQANIWCHSTGKTYVQRVQIDGGCTDPTAVGPQTSGYVCESPADTGDHRHFQLAGPFVVSSTQVFVDGVRQRNPTDYTESPSTGEIIFASSLTIPEADSVYVCYTAIGDL